MSGKIHRKQGKGGKRNKVKEEEENKYRGINLKAVCEG